MKEIIVKGKLHIDKTIDCPDGLKIRGRGVITTNAKTLFNVRGYLDVEGDITFENIRKVFSIDNSFDIRHLSLKNVTTVKCRVIIGSKRDRKTEKWIKKAIIENCIFRDFDTSHHVYIFRPFMNTEYILITKNVIKNIIAPANHFQVSLLFKIFGSGKFSKNRVENFGTRSISSANSIVYNVDVTGENEFICVDNTIKNVSFKTYPVNINKAKISKTELGYKITYWSSSKYQLVAGDKIRIWNPGKINHRNIFIITEVKGNTLSAISDSLNPSEIGDCLFYLISSVRPRYNKEIEFSGKSNMNLNGNFNPMFKTINGYISISEGGDSKLFKIKEFSKKALKIENTTNPFTRKGTRLTSYTSISLYENPYMRAFYPHIRKSFFGGNEFENVLRPICTKRSRSILSDLKISGNTFIDDSFDQIRSEQFLFNDTNIEFINNELKVVDYDNGQFNCQNHVSDYHNAKFRYNKIQTDAKVVFKFNNQKYVDISHNEISHSGCLIFCYPIKPRSDKERYSSICVTDNNLNQVGSKKSSFIKPVCVDVKNKGDELKYTITK